MSCLYILEINLLSLASFPNIFFHSEVVFLSHLWLSLCKKLLHLIRSHLFSFVFIFIRRWVKKISAAIYVKEYSADVFL